MHRKHNHVCGDSASSPEAKKSLYRQFEGVHQMVSGNGLTTRTLLIVQIPTGPQRRVVRERNGNSDASKWPALQGWDCAMECDQGVRLALALLRLGRRMEKGGQHHYSH